MRRSAGTDDALRRGSTSRLLRSRSRRFIRFRSTTPRWYLGTTSPILGRGPAEDKKKTSKCDVFLLLPLRNRARISRVLVIRLEGGIPKPAGVSSPGHASPTGLL